MAKRKEEPKVEPDFTPRRYRVSFAVYPSVPMARESALEFAKTLGARHELTDIHMSDESWVFQQPQTSQAEPRGMIRVTVEEQEIKVEHHFPAGRLERFEKLVDDVVAATRVIVNPRILLSTEITLEYVTKMGGDARQAILDTLQLSEGDDDADKLAVFGRPCHVVGVRFMFPPYAIKKTKKAAESTEELMDKLAEPDEGSETGHEEEEDGDEDEESEGKGEDWQVTLTIESLVDDPHAISVEVTGRWLGGDPWQRISELVNKRLVLVERFLHTETVAFLKHFRSEQ
ncbi:MAG: hypothetical protein ACJ8FY_02440 [Gemmataceae bacterium]